MFVWMFDMLSACTNILCYLSIKSCKAKLFLSWGIFGGGSYCRAEGCFTCGVIISVCFWEFKGKQSICIYIARISSILNLRLCSFASDTLSSSFFAVLLAKLFAVIIAPRAIPGWLVLLLTLCCLILSIFPVRRYYCTRVLPVEYLMPK